MTATSISHIPDWFTDIVSADFDVQLVEPLVYNLGFDALAYLMHLRIEHSPNTKYANMIFGNTVRSGEHTGVKAVSTQAAQAADSIRQHYKNKLMIVSLKGNTVSDFRQRVNEIIDNPRTLRDSDIPVILRMPDFYAEDQAMQELVKNYQSVSGDSVDTKLNRVFHYAGRVERVVRRNPFYRYYWHDHNRNLLCMRVEQDSRFMPMVEYFVNKSTGMGVRGTVTIQRETGYNDFRFYYLGNNYELY
jgi:hypothetical protein